MRDLFVKTENASNFMGAVARLQDRGAEEACLMIVDGIPGLGKSHTLQWYSAQQGCLYLRAKKEWTPAWMLRELLQSLNVSPAHSFEKMYRQALEKLGTEAQMAEHNDEIYAVVIDEVDHICRSSRLLETIRDLSDMLEIPFIMVGMGRVRDNLSRFPQIASRVGQYVAFNPATLEDVTRMVNELCEVEVKNDLIAQLHKASNGLVREIKEGINAIERFGKVNDGPIGAKEMVGEVLLNDRRTGRQIMVKG